MAKECAPGLSGKFQAFQNLIKLEMLRGRNVNGGLDLHINLLLPGHSLDKSENRSNIFNQSLLLQINLILINLILLCRMIFGNAPQNL